MIKRIGCLILALVTVLSLAVPAFGAGDGEAAASVEKTTREASAKLAAPTLRKVGCTASGVQIQWNAVAGAAKYRVFYKTAGGGWKRAGDTDGNSFTWKKAQSGTAYAFTVRCVSADGKKYVSSYDKTGLSLTYIAAPTLREAGYTASGIQIRWNAVAGAAKYRVFYKTAGGSWKRAGDTDGTSFTWKKAQSGTAYAFTVRCVSADGKRYTSAYDRTGLSLAYVAAPTLRKVSYTAYGVQVQWDAVAGAAKYRVFYKTAGSGWKRAGDTVGTSLIWAGAQSGTAYTFTVRCVSADGKRYTSAYNKTGKSLTYLSAPLIVGAESTASGVQIQWNAVTGAARYRVFYKTAGGSWKRAGDTDGTSFTWTGAKSGTAYTFTVRCVSADGKTYVSAYDRAGKAHTYSYAAVRPLDNLGKTGGLNQGDRGCCMATSFSMAANLILGRDEYGAFDWTAGPSNDSLNIPGGTSFEGTDGMTYKPYVSNVTSAEELQYAIDTALAGGCPIIASVQNRSTAGAHYVVVVGWTNEDHSDYLIADPAIAGGDSIEECAVSMFDYRGFSLGNKNGTFVYIAFSRS